MTPETVFLANGDKVTLIHYLMPIAGEQTIACMPGLKEFNATKFRSVPHMRTDAVSAVTCPMCKKTEEYKRNGGK